MRKILLVNTLYREYGGENANISEDLKFLNKSYEVDYLEFDNKKINISAILSFLTASNLISNKMFKKRLLITNPDYVYFQNLWFKANTGVIDIAGKLNYRIVLKIHNFRFDCGYYFFANKHIGKNEICAKCGFENKKFKILNKYFSESYTKSFFIVLHNKQLIKKIKKYNVKVILLNKIQRDNLVSKGIVSKKIKVLQNPLQDKTTNLYNPNSNYVVYAGRISKSKGVEELLRTWESLNINNLNIKIIGDGEIKNTLEKNYKKENIEFLGALDNHESAEYIKNSKAVITSTKMYEGQSKLITEAFSYGVPAIFPNYGSMKSLIPFGYQLSFIQFDYVDLSKKIKMLTDSDLLIKQSNIVYKFIVDHFDSDRIANKLDNFIEGNL
jgi:glycosyltransferase involved in cell wall biosynthesis